MTDRAKHWLYALGILWVIYSLGVAPYVADTTAASVLLSIGVLVAALLGGGLVAVAMRLFPQERILFLEFWFATSAICIAVLGALQILVLADVLPGRDALRGLG